MRSIGLSLDRIARPRIAIAIYREIAILNFPKTNQTTINPIRKEKIAMTYLSPVEKAKKLRTELKTFFPGVKFWVTSKNSINVTWIDGPTDKAVSEIADKYEEVSRCNHTNEILSGGNIFVCTKRLYSKESLTYAIAQMAARHPRVWDHIDFSAIELKSGFEDRGFNFVWNPNYQVVENCYRNDLVSDLYKSLREVDLTEGVPTPNVITEKENPKEDIFQIDLAEILEYRAAVAAKIEEKHANPLPETPIKAIRRFLGELFPEQEFRVSAIDPASSQERIVINWCDGPSFAKVDRYLDWYDRANPPLWLRHWVNGKLDRESTRLEQPQMIGKVRESRSFSKANLALLSV